MRGKAEGPIKRAGFRFEGPGQRFGPEHLSHSLGAMNAIDEPGKVNPDRTGASTQPLQDLR